MKNRKNVSYSFDPYLVEAGERRLWRNKELISITPKAFDTLIVLLENKGKVVEKNELLNEVWQDTFVEESTLAQNISTLRKTLGETISEDKQFIETVPRHGYRFVADVREIIGDEEIIVLEHRVRTQISATQEKFTDEAILQTETNSHIKTNNRKVSIAKKFLLWLQKNKLRFAVFVVAGCLTLAAVAFVIRNWSQNKPLSESNFKQIEVSKLTSDGNVARVTISPDGKYLALVEQRGENQTLFLRQIDNSTAIEISPPKKQKFVGLTFSNDGQSLYFVSYDLENNSPSGLIGNLYKIPILGGTAKQITADVDSPITISPDGQQYAFVRNYLGEKQSALITAFFDRNDERKLTVRDLNERFLQEGLAWSPDGKTIAATAYNFSQENGLKMRALTVNTNDGEQKPLGSESWDWIANPNWLKDGSALVFVTYSERSGDQADEIHQISYPEGIARKITGGVNGIYGLGLTADSKCMTAVKSEKFSSFWTSSAAGLKQAVKITNNLTDYNLTLPGLDWTRDGKIIFGATLNGNLDIWMMDSDGSHKRQITTDKAADSMPFVDSENQNIFFLSNRSGRQNVWRMKIDGSELKQVTGENQVASPSLSPDGKYIFYTAIDKSNLKPLLHKISVDGGDFVQLTSLKTLMPKISPDGTLIVCFYPSITKNIDSFNDLKLTILSAENGKIIKQFESDGQIKISPLSWSNNTNFNYLSDQGGGSQLWRQSINEDKPQMIFASPNEKIFRFAFSADGQNLVYEQGTAVNDIILVKSVEN